MFCGDNKFDSDDRIEEANCQGNPSSATELNNGNNGHCTGPYQSTDGYDVGGWHRGRLYELAITTCTAADRGNGRCDAVCNNVADDWDYGDCCEDSCFNDASKPYNCGHNEYNCKGRARPYYIFTHRANSLDLIKTSMDSGANGIEFDVANWYGTWQASHGTFQGPDLTEYMEQFKKDVVSYEGFSALWVDNKDPEDSASRAADLQRTVRNAMPADMTIIWAFPYETPAKYIEYFNDDTYKSSHREGMTFWVHEPEHVSYVDSLCNNLKIRNCLVDVGYASRVVQSWNTLEEIYNLAMMFAKGNAAMTKKGDEQGHYGIKNAFIWTVNTMSTVSKMADKNGVIIGAMNGEYSDSFDPHVRKWKTLQTSGHLANKYDRPWNLEAIGHEDAVAQMLFMLAKQAKFAQSDSSACTEDIQCMNGQCNNCNGGEPKYCCPGGNEKLWGGANWCVSEKGTTNSGVC